MSRRALLYLVTSLRQDDREAVDDRLCAMKFIGEGEVRRLADGRVVFRAKHGTLRVKTSDDTEQTTTSTSFADLATSVHMTDEEARETFDAAARRHLGTSGEEFLRRWDAGEWPDPDAVEGVMAVVMLIPLVRPGG